MEAHTWAISMPVSDLTRFGTLAIISKTSPVNLAAPTSPSPDEIMVIFFAWEIGAATSAAIYKNGEEDRNKKIDLLNVKIGYSS